MPKRNDIRKILIIGSGPIVIGQACEFDYSGTQACKALREEGYSVVLVNSNPATIMTDPELADRTYVEPITWPMVARIIEKERPDALLPTLGGQTGLNTAIALHDHGVLKSFGVELIGAKADAIHRAEDRKLFKQTMLDAGLDLPRSGYAYSMREAHAIREQIPLPLVIRPSFTLGGSGGGIAYNIEEFEAIVSRGLDLSPIREILIEESVYGWKEFELEVMRDRKDNVVIVCSIENLDPMGIHTGDSITVAPAQTLTDLEYQRLRDQALTVIRAIGVETGGSNIQFAVNPRDGRIVVIEMNPRVSRSSALASKATGFPIAKIAAKLAVGYTLDEIPNDITKKTPACFEPAIDYCVVKTPRFAFEKFPDTDPTLTIQMKSVGETMSIGRTFKEALQKSLRSLETARTGLGWDRKDLARDGRLPDREEIRARLVTPHPDRLYYVRYALKHGMPVSEIADLTRIDPWFLDNIREIVEAEDRLAAPGALDRVTDETLREAKRLGFSDPQLAAMWGVSPGDVRARRLRAGIRPVYKLVDTCAAEFEAFTPYYYSTYEVEDELRVSERPKIVILGGGPNRIGQGIEFDYCCVHAAFALRELGFETLMVNSNPETVSTDYDTSDQLFFEPLTEEDVLNICDAMKPMGVIVQLGGQTPLNLARAIRAAGWRILGTPYEAIDRAEDRKKFNALVEKLQLLQPPGGTAMSADEARVVAASLGYPVLVRPSYVLGGRAMEIVYDESVLERFVHQAIDASPGHPVLIDKFIEDAVEVDVDSVSDGTETVIGGILEHVEEAGTHSGDAGMILPPYSLPAPVVDRIRSCTRALASELGVVGLMNVQYAVKGEDVYVLEVNPRASRTVPFVSKAIGLPLAKIAAQVMVGKTLRELGVTREIVPAHVSMKESVFPFAKFPGSDIILGPEMKSTGEVMGIDADFAAAYAKAQLAASHHLPTSGKVFVSLADADKADAPALARRLLALGFSLCATEGTARVLAGAGIPVQILRKMREGRPNPRDAIINKEIALVVNTPSGKGPKTDEARIRAAALHHGVTVITTIRGAFAAADGIEALQKRTLDVKALQDYHPPRKQTAR